MNIYKKKKIFINIIKFLYSLIKITYKILKYLLIKYYFFFGNFLIVLLNFKKTTRILLWKKPRRTLILRLIQIWEAE